MSLKLSDPPTIEPVTLDEMKEHLHYSADDQDDRIESLIKAARGACEQETNRAIITQSWTLGLNSFPAVISVPLPPLQSVESIVYVDENGTSQTLDADQYQVDIDSEPGRIKPARNCDWPSVDDESFLPVKVTFVCGYADAANVPDELKHAVKLLVANWFDNLSPVVTGTSASELTLSVKMLLAHWKSFYQA
jgi:uncharacterized phiE125 gp8 family phage protein